MMPFAACRILEKCYLFIAGLFIVENFLGLNVSALVSLGSVGGLAVALSTQAVLADLIAGLIVFLDEPFKVCVCATWRYGGGDVRRAIIAHADAWTLVRTQTLVVVTATCAWMNTLNASKVERARLTKMVFNFTKPSRSGNGQRYTFQCTPSCCLRAKASWH
jgi:hypothetical protein